MEEGNMAHLCIERVEDQVKVTLVRDGRILTSDLHRILLPVVEVH